MSLKPLLVIGLLALPAAARAQAWQVYRFEGDGFAVQLPAAPAATHGTFTTGAGLTAPSTTYALEQEDALYSLTVIDFTRARMDRDTALAEGVKAFGQTGEIKLNIQERIDAQFGRQLTVADKDGARSTVAVFFVNGKLYELEGRALPPDPGVAAGKTVRFQQSLEFIGLGAEARRPENRIAGDGPGGPGRFGPPPQAFAQCRGKAAGDAIQFSTPRGEVVPATCVRTPQGLAARPDRPPPGAGPEGPPPPPDS